jgi:hypothetical protein
MLSPFDSQAAVAYDANKVKMLGLGCGIINSWCTCACPREDKLALRVRGRARCLLLAPVHA